MEANFPEERKKVYAHQNNGGSGYTHDLLSQGQESNARGSDGRMYRHPQVNQQSR